ncbi:hypothetical protein ACK8HE_18505 [Enterobacter hormaechei]|uniref:hypothetical protein n=1 Tax=Enterobacter hormaechei TaxID=158836 RepID=UPI0039DFD2E9
MANKLKQNITPVEVSAAMNFDATDMHWQYQSGASSMAAKQAEGVAGLWNLLNKPGGQILKGMAEKGLC